jgi:hypothetical protein
LRAPFALRVSSPPPKTRRNAAPTGLVMPARSKAGHEVYKHSARIITPFDVTVLSVTLNAAAIMPSANNRFRSSLKFLSPHHSIGAAGITCRNGSRSESYWTKTRQGIKLVNALSEESVGQSNHGLEANPTTDSSLKSARGACSPASRAPRVDLLDLQFTGLPKHLRRKKSVRRNC